MTFTAMVTRDSALTGHPAGRVAPEIPQGTSFEVSDLT
jgi:hypothetical protein